jgi:hypothetical protein
MYGIGRAPTSWLEGNVSRETFILLFKDRGLCYLLLSRSDGDDMCLAMGIDQSKPKKTQFF